jgi:hypothetical protein
MEMNLLEFLTCAEDGGEWLAPGSGRTIPEEGVWGQLIWVLYRRQISLLLPGIETQPSGRSLPLCSSCLCLSPRKECHNFFYWIVVSIQIASSTYFMCWILVVWLLSRPLAYSKSQFTWERRKPLMEPLLVIDNPSPHPHETLFNSPLHNNTYTSPEFHYTENYGARESDASAFPLRTP